LYENRIEISEPGRPENLARVITLPSVEAPIAAALFPESGLAALCMRH